MSRAENPYLETRKSIIHALQGVLWGLAAAARELTAAHARAMTNT